MRYIYIFKLSKKKDYKVEKVWVFWVKKIYNFMFKFKKSCKTQQQST